MSVVTTFPTFECVAETQRFLGLPTEHLHSSGEFDVQELRVFGPNLPIRSPTFRATYFTFVFISNGRGRFTVEGQTHETRTGMVYFTNPGHCLSPEACAEFDWLCSQLCTEYLGDSPYRPRILGSLVKVMLLKIKDLFWHDYQLMYEGDRSSQIVRGFKDYLEQHFRDLNRGESPATLRAQDCAASLNLHPNSLNIVIKGKTGKSVSTWIAEKTVSEAKLLLQNTSLPISTIAHRLGYTESAHFSTFFKKVTGQSPVVFRRQTTS